MDEIQRILDDPEAMERISRMAQQLMGGAPETQPPGETPPVGALGELLTGKKGGTHPLAETLGPYLDQGRRRRLERALSAARAVRLSGSLLGRGGHGL